MDLDLKNLGLLYWALIRSSRPEVFCEKGVLRNFSKLAEKYPCRSLVFNQVKKETLAQVFSCEFCVIF